ncbi:MAG: hypothetical protein ACRDLC_14295, partial [Actinomycetota bacterium]
REPPDVVLPAFVDGGTSLVWTWFAVAWTYAILLVPILLLPAALGRRDDPAAQWHHRGEVLTWEGESLTVAEWSQRTGIRVKTLLERCRKGWSVEQVLTTPPGGSR